MVRKRYIRGQLMKSPALLGEIAPSTWTPSTGVEIRSAGDASISAGRRAGSRAGSGAGPSAGERGPGGVIDMTPSP